MPLIQSLKALGSVESITACNSPASYAATTAWATSAKLSSTTFLAPSDANVSSSGYPSSGMTSFSASFTSSKDCATISTAALANGESAAFTSDASLSAAPTILCIVSGSRARRCWPFIQLNFVLSNTAPLFVIRSSANLSQSSSTVKISCSVPSFHPRRLKKLTIASLRYPSSLKSPTEVAPWRLESLDLSGARIKLMCPKEGIGNPSAL
mmetsp:Transcript_15232/g.43320  ORF Transcript_15232/g.43320 Transcript_15232/m.43320 type:complete len:210 (+) Transcript_15232:249-878(+)